MLVLVGASLTLLQLVLVRSFSDNPWALLFANNGENPKRVPQIELDGQLLHYNQNSKFWSVYLTTKLNWRLQTENLINETRKRLNFLKIVSFSFSEEIHSWC